MMILKLILKDVFRWIFWYPFRWLLTILPLAWAYTLGDFMAEIIYRFNTRRKEKIRTELSWMDLGRPLAESEIQSIIHMGVQMFFWNQMDILLYPKLMREPIERYTVLEGEENLKTALANGKGVILVHIHSGNPQMLMPALGYRNYPINQVGLTPQDLEEEQDSAGHIPESLQGMKTENIGLPPGSPPPTPMLKQVLELMHQLELSLPAKFVYLGKSLLPAFRCLKKNELLAIAIDGAGGRNRILVTLCGRKASFSKGPVAMALREGAVILPLYISRLSPSYRHQIVIDTPLELSISGDTEQDIIDNTQALADRFTKYVSKHPGQYARLLGYKRPFFAD
jgi:lauroyl/myristoyl acyltransferase